MPGRFLLCSGVALACVAAHPAWAADAGASPAPASEGAVSDDPNLIVVTASRLPRDGFDPIDPPTIVDSKLFDARGYTNVGDALNEIPQFGVPKSSPVGSQTGTDAGQTFVDLFNLGSQRTLTLVNGRRFVSSNTASFAGPTNPGGQVDLNLIPESMVDRVEVIAVGGAPIYGSDAIAGTVNIILKQKFDGLQIDMLNGVSQKGDAGNHRISAVFGRNFADGRGNVTVSGEWNKHSGLTTADRTLTSGSGPFFGATNDPDAGYAAQLYYGQRYNIFTPYGTPMFYDIIPEYTGITDANGNVLTFNKAGKLVPLDFGTRTGSAIVSAGGNGFAVGDYDNLLATTERYLGTMQASFQISDAARLFGEAWYSHSKATNLLRQPYYSSYLFGAAGTNNGNLVVSLDNPFLDAADRQTIADYVHGVMGPDENSFYLSRASTDLQSGRLASTEEMYRFVGGIDGDFSLRGKPWRYEASLTYGRSSEISRSRGVVFQNLQNALNSTTDANGNIVCAPGYTSAPIKTFNSSCSAFDPFGQSSTAMQKAAIDYITALAETRSINTQLVGDINIHGPLFTLPAGDVTMVLGYEHRHEHTSFDPGAYYYGETLPDGTREAYGNSIPVNPISGGFDTDEGFTELRVPLVSPGMDVPFVDRFELQGAARYVHNSLSGGGWTYTAGGTIAPIPDISFRGNYTRSIRSPSVGEVFTPQSSSLAAGADPCDVRYIGQGPNPARRAANCAAAGVPEAFYSNYSEASVPGEIIGNTNLKNERANSYTFGTVLRPRFVPGLTISGDYVNISLKNAIQLLSSDQVLNACYDAISYPSSFCGLITRNASGQITLIKQSYYNVAISKLSAFSAELDYQLDLRNLGLKGDPGGIDFKFNFYHVMSQYTKVGTGDVDHSAGEVGNPRNSFTANLDYKRKGFDVAWQTQYYGPSVFDADGTSSEYQYPGVKHWYLFNASAGYAINDAYKIRLIVNNVFDKSPPFPSPAGNGTITYFSGLLGRYFSVSVGAKF